MDNKRKSPYLVLGVRFGASKDEAAKAFARATRRLRSSPDAPFDIEDLNWALHAVEQRIEDPAMSIDDYRVPADTTAYQPESEQGILNSDQNFADASSDSDQVTIIQKTILRRLIASATNTHSEYEPLPTLYRFVKGVK